MGEQFCMVAPHKLNETALKNSKVVKNVVRKQMKDVDTKGKANKSKPQAAPHKQFSNGEASKKKMK
jgi:hypothetical protein